MGTCCSINGNTRVEQNVEWIYDLDIHLLDDGWHEGQLRKVSNPNPSIHFIIPGKTDWSKLEHDIEHYTLDQFIKEFNQKQYRCMITKRFKHHSDSVIYTADSMVKFSNLHTHFAECKQVKSQSKCNVNGEINRIFHYHSKGTETTFIIAFTKRSIHQFDLENKTWINKSLQIPKYMDDLSTFETCIDPLFPKCYLLSEELFCIIDLEELKWNLIRYHNLGRFYVSSLCIVSKNKQSDESKEEITVSPYKVTDGVQWKSQETGEWEKGLEILRQMNNRQHLFKTKVCSLRTLNF